MLVGDGSFACGSKRNRKRLGGKPVQRLLASRLHRMALFAPCTLGVEQFLGYGRKLRLPSLRS